MHPILSNMLRVTKIIHTNLRDYFLLSKLLAESRFTFLFAKFVECKYMILLTKQGIRPIIDPFQWIQMSFFFFFF